MCVTFAETAPLIICIELCCPTGMISRPSTSGTFGRAACGLDGHGELRGFTEATLCGLSCAVIADCAERCAGVSCAR